MLSCLRQLTAKGGDLKLSGLSKQVRAAFELVRMHRVLNIDSGREAACVLGSTAEVVYDDF
jgi:anti-sigma B factor antagonist